MSATVAGGMLTEAHRIAQAKIGDQTAKALEGVFGRLDPANLSGSFGRWFAAVEPIVAEGRQASSVLGGAYVSAFRARELGPDRLFRPVLASAVDPIALRTSMLVTGPVSLRANLARSMSLDEALRRSSSASSAAGMRHALNGGRDTIVASVGADSAARGWQRVTSGHSCAFCALLAAKGAVYSAESVRFRCHDGCHCTAEPVYGRGSALPPTSQQYRKLYNESTAGVKDPLKAFRAAVDNVKVPPVVVEPAADRAAVLQAEKSARRLAEARARREAERNLTARSPDVVAAAERFGVSPDDVFVARHRVAELRAAVRESAARAQLDAIAELDRFDIVKLKAPPRIGARSATGRKLRGGEYDFLEKVSKKERIRLARDWYRGTQAPDQFALNMSEVLHRDVSVDEAMARWMDLNRRVDASGALRGGKLPADGYSGAIDPNALVSDVTDLGYDVAHLFGDDLNAAAHIARVDSDVLAEDAFRYLEDAANAVLGPAPYRMSFQSWEEEVRGLEQAHLTGSARYAELVPRLLDDPGLDFEELYARIVSTARKAKEEVPGYASIPWN